MRIRSEQQEHKELFEEIEGTIEELNGIIACIEGKIHSKENDESNDVLDDACTRDYEYWTLKLELRTKKAHLKVQERVLKDRKNHYENIFLPNFEKKSTQVNIELEKVEARARDVLTKRNVPGLIGMALKKTLDEFPKEMEKLTGAEEKQNLRNQYYDALKKQIEDYQKSQRR